MNDDLMNGPQVARYLGCSTHLLKKWRSVASGPPWLKIGRMVRYRKSEVDEWLAQAAIKRGLKPESAS